MESSEIRRNDSIENQIVSYASRDIDNYIKNDYNFEIVIIMLSKSISYCFKYFDRRIRNNISTFFK